MLINSDRHTVADIEEWRRLERFDKLLGRNADQKAEAAIEEIEIFKLKHHHSYVGTSWGKDSLVICHLVARAQLKIPIVWFPMDPLETPECRVVRDKFLARYPNVDYREAPLMTYSTGDWWLQHLGTFSSKVLPSAGYFDGSYVSGIRGEESSGRKQRMKSGIEVGKTCAPIGYWTGEEVFAYLHYHDLPIHPAYAMSFGGTIDRKRLRVSFLGGEQGTGKGRGLWEQKYYGDRLAAVVQLAGEHRDKYYHDIKGG